jgi:hypothetical protein
LAKVLDDPLFGGEAAGGGGWLAASSVAAPEADWQVPKQAVEPMLSVSHCFLARLNSQLPVRFF